MARSDYTLVPINQTLTENNPTVTRSFNIEGTPININNRLDAYLLIQVRSVGDNRHRISINNRQLPGFDLPSAPGRSEAFLLWMDHIPANFLRSGRNTITITRTVNDNFEVRNVVVHWREL